MVDSSGKSNVAGFIQESLFDRIGHSDFPSIINAANQFENFLVSRGQPTVRASDLAEKWLPQIRNHLEMRLKQWDSLGIPRPFDFLESPEENLITLHHPKFRTITGREPPPNDFAKIYRWIRSTSGRDLLLVGAILLKSAGANYIAITDQSGDCGVDIIGRIDSDFLGPHFIFLQARGSTGLLSRETVLAEHGKFRSSTCDKKLISYRTTLRASRPLNGGFRCYLFITNSEFREGARGAAASLDFTVKSCKEMALSLSKATSFGNVRKLQKRWSSGVQTIATKNIAPEIEL